VLARREEWSTGRIQPTKNEASGDEGETVPELLGWSFSEATHDTNAASRIAS
jgi:hypothetical protein